MRIKARTNYYSDKNFLSMVLHENGVNNFHVQAYCTLLTRISLPEKIIINIFTNFSSDFVKCGNKKPNFAQFDVSSSWYDNPKILIYDME